MKQQIRSKSANNTVRITRKKGSLTQKKHLDLPFELHQLNQEHKIPLLRKPQSLDHSITLHSSSLKVIRRSKNKFAQPFININIKTAKEQPVSKKQINFGKQQTQGFLIHQDIFTNINTNILKVPLSSRKRKRSASPSVQVYSLNKKQISEFILKQKQNEGGCKHGYWKTQNKFVSLIPLQNNQKVSFYHKNLLTIHAQVMVDKQRYVVSDQYQNCSLQNLLDQFGYFNQQLVKRYLKQVALGLQHMHYHHKPHNRISTRTILYNKNGQLFVNTIKSTSFALSKEELANHKDLYSYAPEFLLTKGQAKSLKNDVWALGCLAISMLTPGQLIQSPLHPYNKDKYDYSREQQMIDNVRQLHQHHFTTPAVKQVISIPFCLSEAAKDFISRSLQIMAQSRPTIQTLLQHQFLQGV